MRNYARHMLGNPTTGEILVSLLISIPLALAFVFFVLGPASSQLTRATTYGTAGVMAAILEVVALAGVTRLRRR